MNIKFKFISLKVGQENIIICNNNNNNNKRLIKLKYNGKVSTQQSFFFFSVCVYIYILYLNRESERVVGEANRWHKWNEMTNLELR